MAPKSKKQNFVKSIESDFLILTMKLWGPVLAGLLSSGMKSFELENIKKETYIYHKTSATRSVAH